MSMIRLVALTILIFVALTLPVGATATYNSGQDEIRISGIENIHSVYSQIGPISGKFEKIGNTYYLSVSSIVIDGELEINDTTVVVDVSNNSVTFESDTTPTYYAGSITIDNSTIEIKNTNSTNVLNFGVLGAASLGSLTISNSHITNSSQSTAPTTLSISVQNSMLSEGNSTFDIHTFRLVGAGSVNLSDTLINLTTLAILDQVSVTGGDYNRATIYNFTTGAKIENPRITGWIDIQNSSVVIHFIDGTSVFSPNVTTLIDTTGTTVTPKVLGKIYDTEILRFLKLRTTSGVATLENVTHYVVGKRYTFTVNSSDPSTTLQFNLEGILPFTRVDVVFVKEGEEVVALGTYYTSVDGIVKILYDKGFSNVLIDAIVYQEEEPIPAPEKVPPLTGGVPSAYVPPPTFVEGPETLVFVYPILEFLQSPLGIIAILLAILAIAVWKL